MSIRKLPSRILEPSQNIANIETQGIKFPATQVASTDPNTLDDYEEGTWTATLEMSTSAVGSDAVSNLSITNTGNYIKIGNCCTIAIDFDVSSYNDHRILRMSLPFLSGDMYSSLSVGMHRGIGWIYAGDITQDRHNLYVGSQQNAITASFGGSSSTTSYTGYWHVLNNPGQDKRISVGGTYITA